MITLSRFLFTFSLSLFLLFLSAESQAATKSCSLLNLVGADYVVTVGCGFDDPIRPDGDIYDPRCSGGKLSNGASCQPGWRCYESWGAEVCKEFRQCATGENWRDCINDYLPKEEPEEPETSPTQCTDDTMIKGIKRYWDTSFTYGLTDTAVCSKVNGSLTHIGCQGKYLSGSHAGEDFAAGIYTFYAKDLTSAERVEACKPYNPDKPTDPETPTASEPKPPSASEPVKSDSEFLKKISETLDKVLQALTGEKPSSNTTGTDSGSGGTGGGTGSGSSGSGTGGGTGGTSSSGGILGELSKLTGEGEYDDGGGKGGSGDFGVGDGGFVTLGGPFTVQGHFATSGSCPAPVSIYGHDFSFSWICEVLFYISRVLIAVAYLWAAFIFYGALVGTTKDD